MVPYFGELTDFCDSEQNEGFVITKDMELVGILFTASWCPPCQAFIPQLKAMYDRLMDSNEKFEIVLVSADEQESDMWAYLAEYDMPWLTCRFDERMSIISRFQGNVEQIPTLVIVEPSTGKVVTYTGTDDVHALQHEAFYKWRCALGGTQFLTEEQRKGYVEGLSPLLKKLATVEIK